MEKRRLILRNHQLVGDSLMMTPAVRDLKRAFSNWEIKVETNHQHIWDNNPHITQFSGSSEVFNIGPRIVTQSSKTSGLHFTMGFRMSLEDQLKIKIPQGPLKPELFLSDYEKKRKVINGKYWVVNIDCGPYAAKRWFDERWQEVVDILKWITFVQVGLAKDNKYRLKGNNVIDYVGKTQDFETGLRDLFTLVYHSQGCLSLVSSLTHIAAAFDKPCVVPAGAREPVTFEGYQMQRYIHKTGCLPCAKTTACWACSKAGCFKKWFPHQSKEIQMRELGEEVYNLYKNKDKKERKKFNLSKWADEHKNKDWVPHCMDMIKTREVVDAVTSYYGGGVLEKIKLDKTDASFIRVIDRPIFKVISNGKMLGGAERSVLEIIKMAQERNYDVELVTRQGMLCNAIRERLSNVRITNKISSPCDVLLLYASDMIWDFHKPEFDVFNNVQAKRKVMALTYHLGQVPKTKWTRNWDLYLFLSSDMEKQFQERWYDVSKDCSSIPLPTKVLAPPIDLTEFYKIQPDYSKVHIMRHSSQGDNKYSKDVNDIIAKCNAQFSFMPAPGFITKSDKVITYSYNQFPVHEFLSKGSCFWYLLPEKYTDQGPRAIMEAMTCGLPVIAEDRDGAKDRVTKETGWLIKQHEEAIDIINSLTSQILKEKGKTARERAKNEFRKEKWIEEITGI